MAVHIRATIYLSSGEYKPAHEIDISDIVIGGNYQFKVVTEVVVSWDTFYYIYLSTGERRYIGESSFILTPDGFVKAKDCDVVLYHEPPHHCFNNLYRKPEIFPVEVERIKKVTRGIGVKIYPEVYYKGLIVKG